MARSASSELVRAYPAPSTGTPSLAQRVVRASLASRDIARRIAELAAEDTPVLLLGETGTGKTLFARELHTAERGGNFATLSCASLGDCQLADVACRRLSSELGQGTLDSSDTLLIDEIGELSPWGQAVLLRALTRYGGSHGPRVVAATHRDLESMVRAGRFSGELLMRLRGATVHLPPLRERRDEVPALALHFLRVALGESRLPFVSLDPLVLMHLELYSWPGNVRELQNVMVSALARARDGVLGVEALPEQIAGTMSRDGQD